MPKSLDPDQAGLFVGSDLGPTYLQRLSADDTSIVGKELSQNLLVCTKSPDVRITTKFEWIKYGTMWLPGPVVQSVVSLIADPGVMSLIPAWSYTFMEIDRGILSTVVLLLPLIQEGLLSVTSKSMCTKYW